MLRSTHTSSEFRCDIAEKAIEMLKEAFGNKLYIFIGHYCYIEKITQLIFTFNSIKYIIKIYEEDNLIVCGIKSYDYKGITYEDDDLFLLTSVRNTLFASEQCIEKFIEYLLIDKYFYVKPIISQLADLQEQINLTDSPQKTFLNTAIAFFNKNPKT